MTRVLLFVLVLCANAATAATVDFTFSYTFDSGHVLSGAARGVLQDDNETILVTELLHSSYSGDRSLDFPTELADPGSAGLPLPQVYLSGANPVNFGTPNRSGEGTPGWIVGLGSVLAIVEAPGRTLENELMLDDTDAWKIAVVPVPPAVWLFVSGLAGLGLGARRRRRGEVA